MKTTLLFIGLLLITSLASAQDYTSQYARGGVVDSMLHSLRYSIEAYGAKPDSATDASAAIQSAINAAYAKGGGTVVVPAGWFSIQNPDTLKANVSVECSQGATFLVPQGYAKEVFVFWDASTNNIRFNGGVFREAGTIARNWTAFKIYATGSSAIQMNHIEHTLVYRARIVFDINSVGSSWINANNFYGNWAEGPVIWLKTRLGGSGGFGGNAFVNCDIDFEASTTFGIDTLAGLNNQFINCTMYDAVGAQVSAVFGAASANTMCFGGNIRRLNFVDLSNGGYYADYLYGLNIGPGYGTLIDKIVLSENVSGNAATPAGDIAIALKGYNGGTTGANSSVRVVGRNSAGDDYGGTMVLQTHGRTSSASYLDAVTITPEGALKWAAPHNLFPGSGLIDSVKTSDTVFVGWIYPGATIDTIRYSCARGGKVTARLEMCDSLFAQAGQTLVDTTTVINQRQDRVAAVSGGTFTLTAARMLRMVFAAVQVMPKEFIVTILGH